MHPVSPVIPGTESPDELKIAENQPEYGTLPARDMGNGVILTRWKLSPEELAVINKTGDLYVFIWTFGKPINPIMLQVEQPENHDEVIPVVETTPQGDVELIPDQSFDQNKYQAIPIDPTLIPKPRKIDDDPINPTSIIKPKPNIQIDWDQIQSVNDLKPIVRALAETVFPSGDPDQPEILCRCSHSLKDHIAPHGPCLYETSIGGCCKCMEFHLSNLREIVFENLDIESKSRPSILKWPDTDIASHMAAYAEDLQRDWIDPLQIIGYVREYLQVKNTGVKTK